MALPPKIESRIGINAPADVVWEEIGDLSTWSSWNPLYSKAEGALRIGGRLNLTLNLPDQAPRDIAATVVDWVPNEQILWAEPIARGWIKAIRYIEVEALTPDSCIFSNGEQFEGFIAPYYMTLPRKRVLRAAYKQLCDVVRDRAVARWEARKAGAA